MPVSDSAPHKSALPEYDFPLDLDAEPAIGLVQYIVAQPSGCQKRHFKGRLAHRGEEGGCRPSQRRIVETGNGHVVGNRAAKISQIPDQPDRHEVVET